MSSKLARFGSVLAGLTVGILVHAASAQISISGTITVGSDAAIGPLGQSLTLSNGTLVYSAPFTTSRSVSLFLIGTFNTNGNDATLSGPVSIGSGTLVKSGNGTLTLSGPNSAQTFGGGISVNGGTLRVGGTAALPSTVTVAVAS